jgi:hypothetical protein
MARELHRCGLLVVKTTIHAPRVVKVNYAWRHSSKSSRGRALQWWLDALDNATPRAAAGAAPGRLKSVPYQPRSQTT